jgi:hypothetical protein
MCARREVYRPDGIYSSSRWPQSQRGGAEAGDVPRNRAGVCPSYTGERRGLPLGGVGCDGRVERKVCSRVHSVHHARTRNQSSSAEPSRRRRKRVGFQKSACVSELCEWSARSSRHDASDLLDVDQAAGSAAHSVPRAMAGWLGCFLPPSQAGSSHSVLLTVARPRRGSTETWTDLKSGCPSRDRPCPATEGYA